MHTHTCTHTHACTYIHACLCTTHMYTHAQTKTQRHTLSLTHTFPHPPTRIHNPHPHTQALPGVTDTIAVGVRSGEGVANPADTGYAGVPKDKEKELSI